jgi:hypothetical protein
MGNATFYFEKTPIMNNDGQGIGAPGCLFIPLYIKQSDVVHQTYVPYALDQSE